MPANYIQVIIILCYEWNFSKINQFYKPYFFLLMFLTFQKTNLIFTSRRTFSLKTTVTLKVESETHVVEA